MARTCRRCAGAALRDQVGIFTNIAISVSRLALDRHRLLGDGVLRARQWDGDLVSMGAEKAKEF